VRYFKTKLHEKRTGSPGMSSRSYGPRGSMNRANVVVSRADHATRCVARNHHKYREKFPLLGEAKPSVLPPSCHALRTITSRGGILGDHALHEDQHRWREQDVTTGRRIVGDNGAWRCCGCLIAAWYIHINRGGRELSLAVISE
jgi:hypothetical protein